MLSAKSHPLRKVRLRSLLSVWVLPFLCFPSGTALAQANSGAPSFSVLSKRAAAARDANRLPEAAALYAKALAINSKWEDGWWALGTLEYDQDHYPQAAQAFERLLSVNPANGTAHAMLGLCQSELGEDESGLRNLLAAEKLGVVKDDQLRKVALYHMGLLQLRTRRFSAARQTLAKLAAERVETPELTTALGLAALLVRPQDAPTEGTSGAGIVRRVGQAEALLARKNFAGATEIYKEIEKDSPDYPSLHIAFGRCLLDAAEVDEAVAEFQRELTHDPRNTNAMLEIAAARYRSDSKDGLQYAETGREVGANSAFWPLHSGTAASGHRRCCRGDPGARKSEQGLPDGGFCIFFARKGLRQYWTQDGCCQSSSGVHAAQRYRTSGRRIWQLRRTHGDSPEQR